MVSSSVRLRFVYRCTCLSLLLWMSSLVILILNRVPRRRNPRSGRVVRVLLRRLLFMNMSRLIVLIGGLRFRRTVVLLSILWLIGK